MKKNTFESSKVEQKEKLDTLYKKIEDESERQAIVENFKEYTEDIGPTDRLELLQSIINHLDGIYAVIKNFKKCTKGIGLKDRLGLLQSIIKKGGGKGVVWNFKECTKDTESTDRLGLLQSIIEVKYSDGGQAVVWRFKECTKDIGSTDRLGLLRSIIKDGDGRQAVVKHFKRCTEGIDPSDRLELLQSIVEQERDPKIGQQSIRQLVAENFKGIAEDIAPNDRLGLLQNIIKDEDGGKAVVENFKKCTEGIDPSDRLKLLQSIIKETGGGSFGGRSVGGKAVIENFKKCTKGIGLKDRLGLLQSIIKFRHGRQDVAWNFKKCTEGIGLKDRLGLLHRIIEEGGGKAVVKNFKECTEDVDFKDRLKLLYKIIEEGGGRSVVENFKECTEGIDPSDRLELLQSIIKHYDGRGAVADNFKECTKDISLNDKLGILQSIIKYEDGRQAVAKNFKECTEDIDPSDRLELLQSMIKEGDKNGRQTIAKNFKELTENLDPKDRLKLLQSMIKKGLPLFHIFRNPDTAELAEKIIEEEHSLHKVNNPEISLPSYTEGVYKEAFEYVEDRVESGSYYIADFDRDLAPIFKEMAETFGYQKMFKYIESKEISLHDNLYASEYTLELYRKAEKVGISKNKFFDILVQVKRDTSEYNGLNSIAHLNTIVRAIAGKDIEDILQEQKNELEGILKKEENYFFNEPKEVFESWSKLQRYYEVVDFLGNKEAIKHLKSLEEEGKDKLFNYVKTLFFHKNSKVSVNSVVDFLEDPKKFLGAESSYIGGHRQLHDAIKPSNYTEIANLDLSAVELRDALVDGAIDNIAVFPPMEIRYKIADDLSTHKALSRALEGKEAKNPRALFNKVNDLLIEALGKPKQPVEKYMEDEEYKKTVSEETRAKIDELQATLTKEDGPRKHYGEINKILKEDGKQSPEPPINSYLKDENYIDTLPEKIREEIHGLIYDKEIGLKQKTKEYVARIAAKGDPLGAIAGDDTANCMPFGDGKNNVYMFNLNTIQFTIGAVTNGRERTIAQSVITKDIDTGVSVPKILEELRTKKSLNDILPEGILANNKTILGLDNVETAPEFAKKYDPDVEGIYKDFFHTYLKAYSDENIDKGEAVIGTGEADALKNLPRKENTYLPQAPVSYSDKKGKEVFILDTTEEQKFHTKKITQPLEQEERGETTPRNVTDLTFEDTLKIAYIEGKAYRDNTSLIEEFYSLENTLIAKAINNEIKERPNLSFKYTNDEGRLTGYLIAYEGILDYEDAGDYHKKPCIYIGDLAAPKYNNIPGGGSELTKEFMDTYKEHYLDKNNPLPIFLEARDSTSYKILKRNLNRMGKDLGTSFKLEELETYKQGEETMHPVIIAVE